MPRKKLTELDKIYNRVKRLKKQLDYHKQAIDIITDRIEKANEEAKEAVKPGFKIPKTTWRQTSESLRK